MKRTPSIGDEIRQSRPFRTAADEAVVALLRTADLLRRQVAAVVEPLGITHQQYNVLRILRGSHPEPLPTLEIAARMIEQTPGITRLLDRLEEKGLVERARGSTDRRCVYCRITDRGRQLVAGLDEPVHELAVEAFGRLGAERATDLISLLDGLRAAFREPSVPAAGA